MDIDIFIIKFLSFVNTKYITYNNNNNDNNNNNNNLPKAVSTRVGKELERPYIKKDLIWYA